MSFRMEYVDSVHGSFFIPKDIKDIIETAQFQRLKNIKQLGLLYKLYPQVNHTRYDHCIGTYFLANRTIENLEKNTTNLKVPEFYKKAVSVAALLHDIAHGPFSHTWETINDGDYNHEEEAGGCIDEIFKVSFLEWKMDRPYLIQLIKSLIKGDSSCLRDQQFNFLFDIVNNKQCKIDVDKLDYLKRDYKYLNGIKHLDVDMDFEDVFINARASSDRSHVEYRYCDFRKIYNIFEARAIFHIQFYRSPYLHCLENIFKNLVLSNETKLERICGINIKDIRSKDVNEFLKLDDDRILDILNRLNTNDGTSSLVKCFEKASIKQIYPVTEEEKLAVPKHLIIKSRIANAGEEIQIEDIRFYGNETELPVFEQKKGYFEAISYFQTVI